MGKSLDKVVIDKFGKHFLLGIHDGEKVWLERPSWDCGWYWGIGYLHTFTNNNNPEMSRDINSHFHFDDTFLKEKIYDSFVEYFTECTLTKKEVWQLLELMKSAYTLRKYSDMIHTHGTHITNNICAHLIENENEYKRINREVLPEIFHQIEILLGYDDEQYWNKIKERVSWR